MNFEIFEVNSKDEWNIFVSKSEQNNLFSKTFFLDKWFKNYKIYFIKEKNVILAGIILGFSGIFGQDNSFPYQGIFLSKDFKKFENHKKSKKYLDMLQFFFNKIENLKKNFKLTIHPSIQDIRPFLWHNYENNKNLSNFDIKIRYTAILDLKNKKLNDIKNELRFSRKEDLKKFKKNKLKIEVSNDSKILNDLHIKTFDRQNKKRTENEIYLAKTLSEYLLKKNKGRLVISKYDQKPISAVMIAYDDQTSYYLIGANDPEFRSTGSNTALLIDQIKFSLDNNFQKFDFMGINSPQRGDFKLSFNPKIYQYFNIYLRK